MTNAGYPRPIDVERGTSGEVKLGVVARWLRGDGEEPSIRKLRPVARLLGIPLLEMMVAAGLITRVEAGFEADPVPPTRRPTIEDDIRESPQFSSQMKDAMLGLLAAVRDEADREQVA